MKPVVSVVMPTRGRVSFVRRAILSVIDQSFPEFELLILDNTPSKEKEAVRQLATLDSRIIFVNRGEVGLTEARHLGAVLAKGKLLALLDSDDYWAKGRLERHVETWNFPATIQRGPNSAPQCRGQTLRVELHSRVFGHSLDALRSN